MRERRPTTADLDRLRRILGGPVFGSYQRLLRYGCDEEIGCWLLELREGCEQLVLLRNKPGERYLHRRDSYEAMLGGLSGRQARSRLEKGNADVTKQRMLLQLFDEVFPNVDGRVLVSYLISCRNVQVRWNSSSPKLGRERIPI